MGPLSFSNTTFITVSKPNYDSTNPKHKDSDPLKGREN